MTLLEALTAARLDFLDDELGTGSTDGYVDDARLIRFFNEAENEACRRKDILYDDTTVTDASDVPLCEIDLVADQRAYTFSQKITRIEHVIYQDGDGNQTRLIQRGYDELERNSPDWRTKQGTPTEYLIRGRKIYPIPYPDSSETGSKLKLEVYRTPLVAVSDDADVFEIDEEWHEGLIYWACHRSFMDRDEDLEDPAAQQDLYYRKFEELFGPPMSAATRRNILEEPRSVHPKVFGYHYTGDDYRGNDW